MKNFEGCYTGVRTKTVFNPECGSIKELFTPMKMFIEKVGCESNQYIVKQENLSNGSIIYLLCFQTGKKLVSTSAGGIDNFWFNDCELVHSWSIPANCEGTLVNATTKFNLEH